LANIKEIQRLRGGDLQVAAQANVQIDAEIGQKDHFRMETKQLSRLPHDIPQRWVRIEATHGPRRTYPLYPRYN